jgi:hypothetical protein
MARLHISVPRGNTPKQRRRLSSGKSHVMKCFLQLLGELAAFMIDRGLIASYFCHERGMPSVYGKES